MMPKDAREVANGLAKKGFRRRENDHAFFHLWIGEKKTAIYTKISQGEREIGDNLLSLMARQIKLTKKQFTELVECPMSFEEYVTLLRTGGHVN